MEASDSRPRRAQPRSRPGRSSPREFHRQGWSVDVERTEGPGHGAELAGRAVQAGVQRIVAVGGDGTVHDVANGVLRHGSGEEVALGVVPIGTGNDFAKLAGV